MRYAKYVILIVLGISLGISVGGYSYLKQDSSMVNRAEAHFKTGKYFEGYSELILIKPDNPEYEKARIALKKYEQDIINDLYDRAENGLAEGQYNLAQSYANQIISFDPRETGARQLLEEIKHRHQADLNSQSVQELAELKAEEERSRKEVTPWQPSEKTQLTGTPFAEYLADYKDLGRELSKLVLGFADVVEGYHLGEVTEREFLLVRMEMVNQLKRFQKDFNQLYNPLPGKGKSPHLIKVGQHLELAIRGLQVEGDTEKWQGLIEYNKEVQMVFTTLMEGYEREKEY